MSWPRRTQFIKQQVSMFDQDRKFRGRCTPLQAEGFVNSGTATVFGWNGTGYIYGITITKPDFWNRRNQAAMQSVWSETAIAADRSRLEAERARREANAPGSHTEQEWGQIVSRANNRCLRCGIPGERAGFGKLTKDHITALSEGGTNYASNLQPLCRSCNSWKGNREIDYRKRPTTHSGHD